MVRYRLLGPVGPWVDGRPIDAGQPRQRAILAALLVDAGQVVASEALIDRLWGESPPRNARGTLRAHVTMARRLLELTNAGGQSPRLVNQHGGYVLDVDRDLIDLHRFRRLAAAARDSGCPDHRRAALLREAVAQWQGTPLTGIQGAWAARMRESWDQERVDVTIAWAHAELRLGDPSAVLGPLAALASEHPLVESLTVALMTALHAAGRPAEALDQYARARARLAEELGIDPGPELQALHQAILRGDQAAAARPATVVLPAQLPADLHGFAGRGQQLARLDDLLAQSPSAVVISAVSGMAGVGKTALAVHWAHRVAARFPDGQLYVNLRGFDPAGTVTTPAEAVRGFLDALGVAPERIPPHLDAQTALYRSLIAGKRTLMVLDNARDAEQVRRLLPGTPTAVALVTSRNRLAGLVAAHGAHPLALDVMPADEAAELLAERLGADRVAAEPDAVEGIATACVGLPLALSIAAARAQQTGFPLATVASELADARDRLDALDAGDVTTELRAVFSWSYATLTTPAARLFRLLGLHPGPDIAVPAAASLAGQPLRATRRLLAELAGASLLAERVPGRYAFHDLLRTHAMELANSQEPEHERRAATARLLDHYLHTAYAADRLVHPARDPIARPLPAASPDTHLEHLADHRQAMTWLTVEHPVLLAAIQHAADIGLDQRTWQLAWVLDTFIRRRGRWHDRLAAWQAALDAAGRLADPAAEAYAHRSQAITNSMLGRFDDARVHYEHALDLYARAGDQAGQGHTHHNLGFLWKQLGDPERSLSHVWQAYALFQAAGHRWGEAEALNAIGWCHIQLGRHDEAIKCCQRARTVHRETGNREGEAHTWDTLGYAYHHLGQHARAADCYRQALDLFGEVADRYHEADSLTRLGDTHRAAGEHAAARIAWKRSLDILTDLDHPDAKAVRAKLHNLAK